MSYATKNAAYSTTDTAPPPYEKNPGDQQRSQENYGQEEIQNYRNEWLESDQRLERSRNDEQGKRDTKPYLAAYKAMRYIEYSFCVAFVLQFQLLQGLQTESSRTQDQQFVNNEEAIATMEESQCLCFISCIEISALLLKNAFFHCVIIRCPYSNNYPPFSTDNGHPSDRPSFSTDNGHPSDRPSVACHLQCYPCFRDPVPRQKFFLLRTQQIPCQPIDFLDIDLNILFRSPDNDI
uniref:Uncharacterized protein n=1 Tax=Romanomermis culicivorax TaxID=13658 RepID=A0A915JA69_ROMCU